MFICECYLCYVCLWLFLFNFDSLHFRNLFYPCTLVISLHIQFFRRVQFNKANIINNNCKTKQISDDQITQRTNNIPALKFHWRDWRHWFHGPIDYFGCIDCIAFIAFRTRSAFVRCPQSILPNCFLSVSDHLLHWFRFWSFISMIHLPMSEIKFHKPFQMPKITIPAYNTHQNKQYMFWENKSDQNRT